MITAPYNFVPLNKKVVYPHWAKLISHDVPFENSLSGTIELEILANTPIFVKDNFAFEWLNLFKKDEAFIKDELLKNAYHPTLKIDIDRPLKAGWEKRK